MDKHIGMEGVPVMVKEILEKCIINEFPIVGTFGFLTNMSDFLGIVFIYMGTGSYFCLL